MERGSLYFRIVLAVSCVALSLCLAQSAAAVAVAPGTGFAHVHHPIDTSNAQAQAAFDRGLTLLYAFSRKAARTAFYQAAAADPRSAMPYWGIAMSYGANINVAEDPESEREAYAATRRAATLAKTAPPSERAYVDALATRTSDSATPDYDALARAYNGAMRDLAAKYPSDVDALTLYAESGMNLRPWDLYAVDGTPRPGTLAICATLEAAIAREPGHIGANHLYVHATEASRHPERALQAAGVLASLNFEPAASHLTHMPAHTWARTGYYQQASGSDVLATAHDRAYLASAGKDDREQPGYYVHDLTFLAYTDGADGDLSRAKATIPRLIAANAYVPALFALLRFERWSDIIAFVQPKPDPSEPIRLAVYHFARGMAFATTGRVDRARSEQTMVRAARAAERVPAANGSNNSSDDLLALADTQLSAKIAEARGDSAAEIALLHNATQQQDRLNYIEPPDWYAPVRESLGGALLRTGHAADAAAVFAADLARNPANPRSLFGLAAALQASGNADGASRAHRRFENGWHGAPSALTLEAL